MKLNSRFLAVMAASSLSLGIAPAVVADSDNSTTAGVPDLTAGMAAPTIDVGTGEVLKGTVQYSNSIGSNDAFSVGAMTNIGASVNASSTPDYSVNSMATFGVDASTINQVIGTSNITESSTTNTITNIQETANSLAETEVEKDFTKDVDHANNGRWWWYNRRTKTRTSITEDEYTTTKTQYTKDIASDITETLTKASDMSGTIKGSFAKTFADDGNTNNVTVNGIGTDANVVAASASKFETGIEKNTTANEGAGTASGGASGSVGTTATANANSSQFVSSFAQAY